MSRDLPVRPHLEHLRKQAKELLHRLQQQDPGARLSDAQHTIAREYGFSSWPRLKAHVERESTPPPNPFVGHWTADLSRSKLHPLNHFRSASVGFAIEGAAVTIDYTRVDVAGRTHHAVNALVADGNEHPSQNRAGFVLCARWLGSHSFEAVVSRNGEREGRAEYVVSPDGNTLTVSASWRGGIEQMSVFARQTVKSQTTAQGCLPDTDAATG
jgi:hypothetical protein